MEPVELVNGVVEAEGEAPETFDKPYSGNASWRFTGSIGGYMQVADSDTKAAEAMPPKDSDTSMTDSKFAKEELGEVADKATQTEHKTPPKAAPPLPQGARKTP